MSLVAMVWAFKQPIHHTQKLVLLALADHADEEHSCHPSVDKLSVKCSLTPRGVRMCIEALEAARLVRTEKRFVGARQTSNRYFLAVSDLPGNGVHPPRPERGGNPGTPDGGVNTVQPPRDECGSPLTPEQHSSGGEQRSGGGGTAFTQTLIEPSQNPQGHVGGGGSASPQSAAAADAATHHGQQGALVPAETTPAKSARGTRLSPQWQPNVEERAFAAGLGLNVDRVAEIFRDYWCGKSGAGATKTDWTATWRNWCRRDAEQGKNLAAGDPRAAGKGSDNSKLGWMLKPGAAESPLPSNGKKGRW